MNEGEPDSLSEHPVNEVQEKEVLLRSNELSDCSQSKDTKESGNINDSLSLRTASLNSTETTSSLKESDEEAREKGAKKRILEVNKKNQRKSKIGKRRSKEELGKGEDSKNDLSVSSQNAEHSTQNMKSGDKESLPQPTESHEKEATENPGDQIQTKAQTDCLFFSVVYSSNQANKNVILMVFSFSFLLILLLPLLIH